MLKYYVSQVKYADAFQHRVKQQHNLYLSEQSKDGLLNVLPKPDK